MQPHEFWEKLASILLICLQNMLFEEVFYTKVGLPTQEIVCTFYILSLSHRGFLIRAGTKPWYIFQSTFSPNPALLSNTWALVSEQISFCFWSWYKTLSHSSDVEKQQNHPATLSLQLIRPVWFKPFQKLSLRLIFSVFNDNIKALCIP